MTTPPRRKESPRIYTGQTFDIKTAAEGGYPGQCQAVNEHGEHCAFTGHPQAPEYHSWIRLVQS